MNQEIFTEDSGLRGLRKRKLKAYEPEQLEVVVDHEEIVGGSSNEQKV